MIEIKSIADFFMKVLVPSDGFNSLNPIKDDSLLMPDFLNLVHASIAEFNKQYPDIGIVFVETYRSQDLQLQYFNSGASQIKTNGMHHYGIAVDIAFKIDGKFSYDESYKNEHYHYLRGCHTRNGLTVLGEWDIGHVQGIQVENQNDLRSAVAQAIKDFQSNNGLVADGIVGPKTIAKAIEITGS